MGGDRGERGWSKGAGVYLIHPRDKISEFAKHRTLPVLSLICGNSRPYFFIWRVFVLYARKIALESLYEHLNSAILCAVHF